MAYGSHDGFPAHELYVNGTLVYSYDPVAAGNDPTNLLPPMDIDVSTSWVSVPSRSATAQGLSDDDKLSAIGSRGSEPDPAIVPPTMPAPIPAPVPVEATQTRQTSTAEGRSYDLAQLAGMVRPANALAGGAGMSPFPGQRVVLDEWPYIDESGSRSCAPVAIDWKFDGAAVGDIAIAPIGGAVFNGRTIQVRADISTGPGTPNRTDMLVRVTTTFSKPGEPDEVAVSEVTLPGDGVPTTRHAGSQPAAASTPAPVAPPVSAPVAPQPAMA